MIKASVPMDQVAFRFGRCRKFEGSSPIHVHNRASEGLSIVGDEQAWLRAKLLIPAKRRSSGISPFFAGQCFGVFGVPPPAVIYRQQDCMRIQLKLIELRVIDALEEFDPF